MSPPPLQLSCLRWSRLRGICILWWSMPVEVSTWTSVFFFVRHFFDLSWSHWFHLFCLQVKCLTTLLLMAGWRRKRPELNLDRCSVLNICFTFTISHTVWSEWRLDSTDYNKDLKVTFILGNTGLGNLFTRMKH